MLATGHGQERGPRILLHYLEVWVPRLGVSAFQFGLGTTQHASWPLRCVETHKQKKKKKCVWLWSAAAKCAHVTRSDRWMLVPDTREHDRCNGCRPCACPRYAVCTLVRARSSLGCLEVQPSSFHECERAVHAGCTCLTLLDTSSVTVLVATMGAPVGDVPCCASLYAFVQAERVPANVCRSTDR